HGGFGYSVGGSPHCRRLRPMAARLAGAAAVSAPRLTPQVAPVAKPAAAAAPAAAKRKLGYKEQRELEQLPAQIEALDAEVAALTAQIQDPAFYRQGPEAVNTANARLAALQSELEQAYARWQALE
ncbi:MAG: ABC transporter ATP-binding protein, partial [Arenimonas sp.]|nr:ABC transporter ATP-binding protein [Arenimonas sp.]